MTARELLLTAFLLGFASGAMVVVAVIYLPVKSMARGAAENRAEIAWLMGGMRADAANLSDAAGAFRQATAAYRPIYPGNSGRADDPDEAWVAWVAEGGVDYWGRRGPQIPGLQTQLLLVLVTVLWITGSGAGLGWQRLADRAWARTWPWMLTLRLWWMAWYSPPKAVIRPKRRYG